MLYPVALKPWKEFSFSSEEKFRCNNKKLKKDWCDFNFFLSKTSLDISWTDVTKFWWYSFTELFQKRYTGNFTICVPKNFSESFGEHVVNEITVRKSVFCSTEGLCFNSTPTRIFSWKFSKVLLIGLLKSTPEKLLPKFFMIFLIWGFKKILRWPFRIFRENYDQNGVNQAFLGPKALVLKLSLNLLITFFWSCT